MGRCGFDVFDECVHDFFTSFSLLPFIIFIINPSNATLNFTDDNLINDNKIIAKIKPRESKIDFCICWLINLTRKPHQKRFVCHWKCSGVMFHSNT